MPEAIQPLQAEDVEAAARIWYRAGKLEHTYLPAFQALTEEQALTVFREHILTANDLWIHQLAGALVGVLAMHDDVVDRLYIAPEAQRQGIGHALLSFAKERCPWGLRLYTHQANTRARAFYEAEGFRAVAFGISPPPESVPDVEYHWRQPRPAG